MNTPTIFSRGALIAVTASLWGCGGGGGDAAPTNGQLTIGLTDAPIESAMAVIVAFTGIELKPAGDGPALDPIIFDEDSCDNFNADTGTCSIDLLALAGMNRVEVYDGLVPAGEYNQVRLLVDADRNELDSYIHLNDGRMCPIWIPSGDQAGLRIVSGITVSANGVTDYTLDFDVRSSLTMPPGLAFDVSDDFLAAEACTENYILKPAIRIVDSTEVGAIAGTVSETMLDDAEACVRDDASQLHESAAVYVFENFDGNAVADDIFIDDNATNPNPVTTASVVYDADAMAYQYEAGFLLAPNDYLLALTCTSGIDLPDADEFAPDGAADQPFGFVAEQTVSVEVDQTADGSF